MGSFLENNLPILKSFVGCNLKHISLPPKTAEFISLVVKKYKKNGLVCQ